MAITATVQKSTSLGGQVFRQNSAPSGDATIIHAITVAPGSAGALTVRTDDDTGSATVAAGHGIVEGDRVDVYWATGHRRGMAAGTVTGNLIVIDGGTGDNLPTQAASVTLIKPTALSVPVTGANVEAIFLASSKLGQFSFHDSGGEELYVLLGAGRTYEWEDGNGVTNPITGDTITTVYVSHGDAASATMQVGLIYNN